MAPRTACQDLKLPEQIKNSEDLVRGRDRDSRNVEANSNIEDNCLRRGDENTQTRNDLLMKLPEQAGVEWVPYHLESKPNSSEKPRCTKDYLVSLADVPKIVKGLVQEHHNKAFIKGTLRSTLEGLLVTILDDS